eukprot:5096009-Pyramimonas_sp.AAC.1
MGAAPACPPCCGTRCRWPPAPPTRSCAHATQSLSLSQSQSQSQSQVDAVTRPKLVSQSDGGNYMIHRTMWMGPLWCIGVIR